VDAGFDAVHRGDIDTPSTNASTTCSNAGRRSGRATGSTSSPISHRSCDVTSYRRQRELGRRRRVARVLGAPTRWNVSRLVDRPHCGTMAGCTQDEYGCYAPSSTREGCEPPRRRPRASVCPLPCERRRSPHRSLTARQCRNAIKESEASFG
jgi:hypothetical protein